MKISIFILFAAQSQQPQYAAYQAFQQLVRSALGYQQNYPYGYPGSYYGPQAPGKRFTRIFVWLFVLNNISRIVVGPQAQQEYGYQGPYVWQGPYAAPYPAQGPYPVPVGYAAAQEQQYQGLYPQQQVPYPGQQGAQVNVEQASQQQPQQVQGQYYPQGQFYPQGQYYPQSQYYAQGFPQYSPFYAAYGQGYQAYGPYNQGYAYGYPSFLNRYLRYYQQYNQQYQPQPQYVA